MSDVLDLTVVVTLLNEAESLPVLQTELMAELDPLKTWSLAVCGNRRSSIWNIGR